MHIGQKSKVLMSMALAVTVGLLLNVQAANAAGKIYITNRGSATGDATVSVANLDGTGGEILGDGDFNDSLYSGPRSIALNTATGKMYVTTDGATMTVAFLDGTGAVSLNYPGPRLSFDTGDIALDTVAGKMYITDFWGTILAANLDGTGLNGLGNLAGTLNNGGLPSTYGVALDTIQEKMYVTNSSSNTVCVANLDGTGGISLGNLNGTLSSPFGIVLDAIHGKIYVANAGNNTVSVANLDGTGGMSLGNFNDTLNGPKGIALDMVAGRIYVVNSGNNTVSVANLDGTGGESLGDLNGTLNNPYGIAVDIYYNLNWLSPRSGATFQTGSTVPVRFQLTDENGKNVTTANATLMLVSPSGALVKPTTGNVFRYNNTIHLYVYSLNTKKLASGTWQLQVTLDDGSPVKTTSITLR
ncbi:MAG: PxKF domain-containing protein [Nitrospirota bacterium]